MGGRIRCGGYASFVQNLLRNREDQNGADCGEVD
jgi:hypothetical protein